MVRPSEGNLDKDQRSLERGQVAQNPFRISYYRGLPRAFQGRGRAHLPKSGVIDNPFWGFMALKKK